MLLFKICDNLFNGSFDAEQKIMQKVDSKVMIIENILITVPMVIFSLFIGPWSDTASRKMLIIISLIGFILLCFCFISNVYFFYELVVEFLWIESVTYYFGGYSIHGAFGYIADTSSVKSRTIRLAIVEGLFSNAETAENFINVYLY